MNSASNVTGTCTFYPEMFLLQRPATFRRVAIGPLAASALASFLGLDISELPPLWP